MSDGSPAGSDPRVGNGSSAAGGIVGRVRAFGWPAWIVIGGLTLTLGLAAVLPSLNHRAYTARASVFLVDPNKGDNAAPTFNPYLSGSNSLVTTAGLLATATENQAGELHDRGEMKSLVDISVSEKPPEPLLYITVTAEKGPDAERDVAAVVDLARQQLSQVQTDGSVEGSHFVTALSVEYSEPRQGETSRMRPTLGILFLGSALTFWCASLVARRRRRPGRPDSAEPGDRSDVPRQPVLA